MSGSRVANGGPLLDSAWLAGETVVCHPVCVNTENDTKVLSQAVPPNPKRFIVQTPNFRCLAYRDDSGGWHDFFDGEKIDGEVIVVPEE